MNSKQKSNWFFTEPVLWLLKFYKHTFSWLFWGSCRFTPTCSEYTYQAMRRYGTIFGLWLGLKRIVRCNPWNPGGFDQVP